MIAERNHIYHLELFDLCDAMPDKSVDMILCDLPYGTTACSWDTIIPIEPMWEAFKRIIKPRGAIVLTATEPFASVLVSSNLRGYRSNWIWDKVRPAGFQISAIRQLMQHEIILIFGFPSVNYYPQLKTRVIPTREQKGTLSTLLSNGHKFIPKTMNMGFEFPRSILTYKKDDTYLHPTQKPVKLFEYLIKTYTLPGELVFDPCVGSGTSAVAARNTERDYICGDFLEEYADMARERVQNSDPYLSSVDKKTGLKQLSLFGE